MKAQGRPEWNAMPGYARAERHQANHPNVEAAFNALEVGLDAATLSEFLREPTLAIGKKIAQANSDRGGDMSQMHVWLADNNDLLTLVVRLATVLVLAERERVEKEEAGNATP